MNGFERRKEKKKESIRQAALELFKTHGFRKVSINEIADKAGVSPTTIYNHFGTREGLVRDIIKRLLQETVEKYRAIMGSDRTFLEKLELIIFDKTELSRQYEGELVQVIASNDPEIRQLVESLSHEGARWMVEVIEEGKRLGYVNPGLSHETVLLYMDILRKGILAHADLFAAPEQNVKLTRELVSLYLYGVMGRKD